MEETKVTLTEGQGRSLTEILHTILHNTDLTDAGRFHTLSGPAGSGKTFVVQQIIKHIPMYRTICLAATTHKAAKVLRRMAKEAGISHRVEVRTIHSALGLTMKKVRGDEVLVKDPFAEERVYDVLIIDESSMLNDELIMYVLETESNKVIFVGDKCQIGPIQSQVQEGEDGYVPTGEDDVSRVFTDVDLYSELTDIVRQAADSPIIRLATLFRLCQDDPYANLPIICQDLDPMGNGVHVMTNAVWLRELIERFKSKEFEEDSDYCRCVCYTNSMVDAVNIKVRQAIHGVDVPELLVGELMVAQEMGQTWKNADEMRIVIVEEHFDQQYEVPCWRVQFENLEDHKLHNAMIVKNEYIADFNFRLNAIAERANSDKLMSGKHWKDFWGMRKKFNTFKHIYAMTAHKSQGSTIDHTFVYTPDFLRFGATMTVKRLLYTATTRSRFSTYFSVNAEYQNQLRM